MFKTAPVWIALMFGTLVGMVAQFVLSRNDNWLGAVCAADQSGWACFAEYALGSVLFGLVCAGLWSATIFIRQNHMKKARIERDTLQVFIDMMSGFNRELSVYLHPMERRLFVETMQAESRETVLDTVAHHKRFKDYQRKSGNRYNALRKKIARLDALIAIIDISCETEKSIIRFLRTVGEFFNYEAAQNRPPAGDSVLEMTAGFVVVEAQKISDHREFAEKINAAYQDFRRHLALDPKFNPKLNPEFRTRLSPVPDSGMR